MDVDTLASMVYDLLVREYETYTEEQILGEIEELYGEELAADLVESATAVWHLINWHKGSLIRPLHPLR